MQDESICIDDIGYLGDIRNQLLGRIVLKRAIWRASAAAALVEEDDTLRFWVVRAFMLVFNLAARSAVQENDWYCYVGIAPFVYVEAVAVADFEHFFADKVLVFVHGSSIANATYTIASLPSLM